jgi:colanic acid/amylovoran biosynthesis protein
MLSLSLMPPSLRNVLGLVTDKEIDAVLDASGFAFGDQHPAVRAVDFARKLESFHHADKPVVLLPQALGPFENADIRDAFSHIVDASQLVFARDELSLGHARQAVSRPERVFLAPDFTNLFKPNSFGDSTLGKSACIVPNQRMVEKAKDPETAAAYVPLLCSCIVAAEDAGLQPILLLHGSHDESLIGEIHGHLGREFRVIKETDPIAIKRILGQSYLVIGSRFHALVSALSQGVPCIATSWSHKYEMLFRDYGCKDLILPVPASEDQVREAIGAATSQTRGQLVARLQEASLRLEMKATEMWGQVDRVLGLSTL